MLAHARVVSPRVHVNLVAVIFGFTLSGPDNDSHMVVGAPDAPRCAKCGFAVDHTWINPRFTLTVKRWDVSFTYDGYLIVSQRFRDVLGVRGSVYRDLPAQPSFFAVTAERQVEFDAERRRTRFSLFCDGCQRFTQVAGATPVFLKDEARLPDELRRTDVVFGSNDGQHPLLLVGPGLAADLRRADLAGLELLAIDDSWP
jgi:hypothetical protein